MRLVVVKVLTDQPGLYGLGCATFDRRPYPVASAIEMYALDRGALPSPRWSLTTPVAYIGVIPIDIITRRAGFRFAGDPADYTRDPVPIGYGSTGSKEPYPYHYFVSSVGPNEQVDLPEFHYITGRGFFCVP